MNVMKYGKAALLFIAACLFLPAPAFADVYTVRNDLELQSVLQTGPDAKGRPALFEHDMNKYIIFIDNVVINPAQLDGGVLKFGAGQNIFLELGYFNFQANKPVVLAGKGMIEEERTTITINGSTMALNAGIQVRGFTTLNYQGTYFMSGTDRFGKDGDDVIINLTEPGSVWQGSVNDGPYIKNITEAVTREGTLVIGDEGKAEMNVKNRNKVRTAETIIGALEYGLETGEVDTISNPGTAITLYSEGRGIGTLNLTGADVDWYTSGSFYVGYHGTGFLNLSEGIHIDTGSIVVGVADGSHGELDIRGEDTVVTLYGRDEERKLYDLPGGVKELRGGTMTTEGYGIMRLEEGATLIFDERKKHKQVADTVKQSIDPTKATLDTGSGYIPKLGLGNGVSIVDASTVRGAVWTPDEPTITGWIIGTKAGTNLDTGVNDQQLLGLDGNLITPVDVNGKPTVTGGTLNTRFDALDAVLNDNKLWFRNNSLLEGNVKIAMGQIVIDNSVVSPGEGSFNDHVAFGRIDIWTKTPAGAGSNGYGYIHEEDSATYIDFNVHGDKNFTAWEKRDTTIYPDGYLYNYGQNPDLNWDPVLHGETIGGHDVIRITGAGELAGMFYLRPQYGYYSDFVNIPFLEFDGASSDLVTKDAKLEYIDNTWRWFKSERLFPRMDEERGIMVYDVDMYRNYTPFSDTANSNNTRSVSKPLEQIYNRQGNEGWLEVLDWVWLMNDKELINALRQLSGETRASSFLMPVRSPWKFAFDRQDVNDLVRFPRLKKDPKCSDTEPEVFYKTSARVVKNDLWITSFYDYLHADDDGNVSEMTNSRAGLLFGYDRALSSRSALGFVFSYSRPQMSQLYSRVTADDFLFGLHYKTFIQKKYEVKLWGSYGFQTYDMRRNFPFPKGHEQVTSSYTGNTVALSSQIAMPLQWKEVIFRPLAALDLNFVQQNGTTEAGYNEVILHLRRSDWTQLHGRLGIKADYSHKRWDFNGTAGYSYLIAGSAAPSVWNRFVTEGDAFQIEGNNLGRHFFNMGLGAHRWLNDKESQMLFLQYNGEYGKNSNTQSAMLGYQIMF